MPYELGPKWAPRLTSLMFHTATTQCRWHLLHHKDKHGSVALDELMGAWQYSVRQRCLKGKVHLPNKFDDGGIIEDEFLSHICSRGNGKERSLVQIDKHKGVPRVRTLQGGAKNTDGNVYENRHTGLTPKPTRSM